MIRSLLLFGSFVLLLPGVLSAGPYAPAGGQPGATAILATDPSIVEWASGATINRGLVEIDNPSKGYATYGGPNGSGTSANTAPIGQPPQPQSTYYAVALGQGGTATLTFAQPIANGSGYDFAVFNTGFSSGNQEWCKPAFVEVSSDGTDFFRFPSVSLTQTTTQIGSYGTLDPTNLYDLAGKDPVGYGTPFDLQELACVSPLLDVNHVTEVRIVDCVGDINAVYATYDSLGHIVNAPWPAYATAGSEGFDLAGVGVINAVPEPSTLVLLASAGLVAGIVSRRRWFRKPVDRDGERQVPTFELPILYTIASSSTRSFRKMSHFAILDRSCRGASHMIVAVLLALAALAGTSRGETIVDFQDPGLSLGPNSYWNGSDSSGGFTSRGAYFNNSYSTDYGSWSGWSYSNVNDTTTPGYANQYAAYTGTGVGGSGNYAVGYVGDPAYGGALPTITIPNGMQVESAMFTNTTCAALSMLTGDQFAKKFGPDDWFKLTITDENTSNNVLGSVDFYLAENGSIVNTWQPVDLSSLSAAKTLEFNLTSSDTGLYGMNTPAYFAMDNLKVSPVPEPSMLALLCGAGIAGTFWRYRRRFSFRMTALSTKECC